MTLPVVIALDGPAGAGKSTVGELLARRLGYFYFDTGALYRAVALATLREPVDLSDPVAVARLVRDRHVAVRPASVEDGRQYDVLLDGEDVSHAIRSPEVDSIVSPVAASEAVREALIGPQRSQVQAPGTVIAGRDIGTVVCPDADLKVFLTASAEERALRRLHQRNADETVLVDILKGIMERDRMDSTRDVAPMVPSQDAVALHTDGLTIDEVVSRIVTLLDERRASNAG